MHNMKFRVVDKAHNEAIQHALFEKGFRWPVDPGDKIYHPLYTVNYLYAEEGRMGHGEMDSTWENCASPEYLLHRGELVEAGGVNPTFDEQQERLHRPVETEVQKPTTVAFDIEAWGALDFSGLEARILGWNEMTPKRVVILDEMDENVQRRHVVRSWSHVLP